MKCLGKMVLVFALCLALLVPAAWAETEATESEAGCENHAFADGVCTACGYVCENHTGSDNLTYADGAKTYNISSEGHAAVFTRTASYTCTTCGKVIELSAETVEEELKGHTFESGVCTVCGYACEHTWVQGKCMICLAVCPHEHTTQSSYTMVREGSYSAINETYHSAVCDGYEEEQCSDCGMTVRLDIVEEGLTENFKHDLDSEGVCIYCGYAREGGVCTHENRTLSWQWFNITGVVGYTADNHTLLVETLGNYICADCGEYLGEELIKPAEQVVMPHDFDADGLCEDCGYVTSSACRHENARVITDDPALCYRKVRTISADESGHTMLVDIYAITYCDNCGNYLDTATLYQQSVQVTERHEFIEGMCVLCGYINLCAHEHTYEDVWVYNKRNYKALDESTHSYEGTQNTMTVCADCGEYGIVADRFEEGVFTEAHSLDENGSCALCGYVYTAPAPVVTPTPEPQPEQQPEQEPEQETATVVKRPAVKNEEDTYFEPTPAPVPESQPMVQMLMAVVESAEQQGAQVSIEIVGAAEIMEAEEHAQLKTLPVQEQILVTLSSIGFDEVVEAAAAAMNLTLSGEAQALREQINARISSLTQEESEQLQEKLTAYFPVEEITANGETYAYFVIELRIEVDGAARIERYGFRLDDETGEWIFVSLSTLEAQ